MYVIVMLIILMLKTWKFSQVGSVQTYCCIFGKSNLITTQSLWLWTQREFCSCYVYNSYHNKRQHLFSTSFYFLIFCDYAIYVWLLYFITCASREKLAKLSIVLSDHRYLSAMIYSTIKTSGQILLFLIHPYKNTDRFKSIYRYSCQNSV